MSSWPLQPIAMAPVTNGPPPYLRMPQPAAFVPSDLPPRADLPASGYYPVSAIAQPPSPRWMPQGPVQTASGPLARTITLAPIPIVPPPEAVAPDLFRPKMMPVTTSTSPVVNIESYNGAQNGSNPGAQPIQNHDNQGGGNGQQAGGASGQQASGDSGQQGGGQGNGESSGGANGAKGQQGGGQKSNGSQSPGKGQQKGGNQGNAEEANSSEGSDSQFRAMKSSPKLTPELVKQLNDDLNNQDENIRLQAAMTMGKVLAGEPDILKNPTYNSYAEALLVKILNDPSSMVHQPILFAIEMGNLTALTPAIRNILNNLKEGHGLYNFEPAYVAKAVENFDKQAEDNESKKPESGEESKNNPTKNNSADEKKTSPAEKSEPNQSKQNALPAAQPLAQPPQPPQQSGQQAGPANSSPPPGRSLSAPPGWGAPQPQKEGEAPQSQKEGGTPQPAIVGLSKSPGPIAYMPPSGSPSASPNSIQIFLPPAAASYPVSYNTLPPRPAITNLPGAFMPASPGQPLFPTFYPQPGINNPVFQPPGQRLNMVSAR